mgnify:CR=1 FL=1
MRGWKIVKSLNFQHTTKTVILIDIQKVKRLIYNNMKTKITGKLEKKSKLELTKSKTVAISKAEKIKEIEKTCGIKLKDYVEGLTKN